MTQMIQSRLAGLKVYLYDTTEDPERKPEVVVVCCHGYGAPGYDLAGLGPEIVNLRPELKGRVRFIFPEAPLAAAANPFGGKAWWQIDLDALEVALAAGSHREMQRDCPDGLVEARRNMMHLIEETLQISDLPYSQLILAGFSQGAMLMTDVAFRLEESPAALGIFSGTLLNLDEWEERMPRRSGLTVLQAHGRQDPLLSFDAAEELHRLMTTSGLNVNFMPFDGQHTISAESIEAFAELIQNRLSD